MSELLDLGMPRHLVRIYQAGVEISVHKLSEQYQCQHFDVFVRLSVTDKFFEASEPNVGFPW
jgi:hypothetical protein